MKKRLTFDDQDMQILHASQEIRSDCSGRSDSRDGVTGRVWRNRNRTCKTCGTTRRSVLDVLRQQGFGRGSRRLDEEAEY
jgi:hypothetical protein